jgi:hypothetical protein
MDAQHRTPLGHCRAQLQALYTTPLPVHIISTPSGNGGRWKHQTSLGHCRAQQQVLYTSQLPRHIVAPALCDKEEEWVCFDEEVERWRVAKVEDESVDKKTEENEEQEKGQTL